MSRICPNCSTILKDHNFHFCSVCGGKLPLELVVEPQFNQRVSSLTHDHGHKFVFDLLAGKKYLRIILLLIFTVVLGGALWWITTKFSSWLSLAENLRPGSKNAIVVPETSQSSSTTTEVVGVADLGLTIIPQLFSAEDLSVYVPYDITFYVEGSGLKDLTALFYGQSNIPVYMFGLMGFINDRFVFFTQEQNNEIKSALIVELADSYDVLLVDSFIKTFDVPHWMLKRIDNHLILSDSQPLIDEISQVAQKTSKNFSQNPKFRSAVGLFPDKGQLRVINVGANKENLHLHLSKYSASPEFIQKAKELLEVKYDKFIISNATR